MKKALTTSVKIGLRNKFVKQGSAVALLFLIQLTFTLPAFSQEAPQIGLGTGFDYEAIKSELISSYTHTGTTAPIQLFYRFGTDKSRSLLQLSYSSLTLSAGGITTTENRGYLQYAWHRKICLIKNKVTFFGGFVEAIQGSHRDNYLGGPQIANNKATEIIFSLSPSVLFELPLKNDLISAQGWVSLIAHTAQDGYALSYPTQKDLAGPKDFLQLASRLSYTKYMDKNFNAKLDYQFQYYSLTKYDPLYSLNHQLVLSLVYKFRSK